ncbi:MAG: hypothetical protein ACI8R4_003673 [Paracoccaceae bacterium]|jgi:hypothetical protein
MTTDHTALGNAALGDIERHFWLARSVARLVGVNLSDAMAEKRLTVEGYCEMVTHCRASNCHEACEHWLAAQTANRPDSAPDYCSIRQVFERLK